MCSIIVLLLQFLCVSHQAITLSVYWMQYLYASTKLHESTRVSIPYTQFFNFLIELKPFRNQTALHKAAWFGYVDICRILVEAGASLNRRDYQVISQE